VLFKQLRIVTKCPFNTAGYVLKKVINTQRINCMLQLQSNIIRLKSCSQNIVIIPIKAVP